MRLFSPLALLLIRKGKFQRILIRKLPQIVPKGRVTMFIGAAEGFLAVNLANTRADVTVLAQESEQAFRNLLRRVCAAPAHLPQARGLAGARFQVLEEPATQEAVVGWLRLHRPATLILSGPRLSPKCCCRCCPPCRCTGRSVLAGGTTGPGTGTASGGRADHGAGLPRRSQLYHTGQAGRPALTPVVPPARFAPAQGNGRAGASGASTFGPCEVEQDQRR